VVRLDVADCEAGFPDCQSRIASCYKIRTTLNRRSSLRLHELATHARTIEKRAPRNLAHVIYAGEQNIPKSGKQCARLRSVATIASFRVQAYTGVNSGPQRKTDESPQGNGDGSQAEQCAGTLSAGDSAETVATLQGVGVSRFSAFGTTTSRVPFRSGSSNVVTFKDHFPSTSRITVIYAPSCVAAKV
jgi:hypothetical protein